MSVHPLAAPSLPLEDQLKHFFSQYQASSSDPRSYLHALKKNPPLSVRIFGDSTLAHLFGAGLYLNSKQYDQYMPALCGVRSLFTEDQDVSIGYLQPGYGIGMDLLRTLGYANCRGFESDAHAARFCKKQGLHVEHGNAALLEKYPRHFDIVLCQGTIVDSKEHGHALNVLLLNRIAGALKRDGYALFTSLHPVWYHGFPSDENIRESLLKTAEMRETSIHLDYPEPGLYLIRAYQKVR